MGAEQKQEFLPPYRDPEKRYYDRFTPVNVQPGRETRMGLKVCPLYAEVLAGAKLCGIEDEIERTKEYCGFAQNGYFQDGSPGYFQPVDDRVEIQTVCERIRRRIDYDVYAVTESRKEGDWSGVGGIIDNWRKSYAEEKHLKPKAAGKVSLDTLLAYANEKMSHLPNFNEDKTPKCEQRPTGNSLF